VTYVHVGLQDTSVTTWGRYPCICHWTTRSSHTLYQITTCFSCKNISCTTYVCWLLLCTVFEHVHCI